MGSVDVPGNSSGPVVKQSAAHFELGANLIDQKVQILRNFVTQIGEVMFSSDLASMKTRKKNLQQILTSIYKVCRIWSYNFYPNLQGKMDVVLMMGRILSDGRMSARVKYDVNSRFSIKANAQVCF